MGRGGSRGRGGGGGGGGFRGRGGRRGGGGGRGRGGRGRGGGMQHIDKREGRHLQMFGEQHPSQELGDFGSPSGTKKPKFSPRGGYNNEKGFRGRGRGHSFSSGGRQAEEDSDDESDIEEQQTPLNELLSLFKSKTGRRKEVQILSDEEEEDDDDQGDENDKIVEESEDEDHSSEVEDDEDEHIESDPHEAPPVSDRKSVNAAVNRDIELRNNKTTKSKNINEVIEEEELAGDNLEETVIEEAEISPDMENEDATDCFLLHFEREMPEFLLSRLKEEKIPKLQSTLVWPEIDKFNYFGLDREEINDQIRKDRDLHRTTINLLSMGSAQPILLPNPPVHTLSKNSSLEALQIKPQLCTTFPTVNKCVVDSEACRGSISELQREILELAVQYYDGYFPIRSIENENAIRNIYCLHAANHILKTRTRILHHNAKMAGRMDVPDSYRDQGFVRPKVLILVPFKDSAYKIIKTLISILLPEEKGNVANKKRFEDEYSGSTLFLPKTNPKPDDYNITFSGNVEDNFKIGMSLTKKTIKLFTGFYSADIIIASPLGLRLIVGAEGEKDREYDFLSSIELLIMDQADIFLMQNWDHALHLVKHLNLQPVTTHGTDFARIRPWALDGLTKYFRQTLMFSSIFSPEHSSLMTKYCQSFSGQIRLLKQYNLGNINNVTVQMPQVFQYFDASSLQNADDERFDFFIKTVLPNFTDKLMSHTMIFVSSYFDFVRLRNHFKREQTSFVQICEYTKDKKLARARDYFYHGQGHFLLYTERVHFFRRLRIKGIGHILFYQLPQYPHFYSELCNSLQEDFQNRKVRLRKNCSVNVIYCKYDTPRLAAVVGSDRASQMLSSEKNVHAFVSGEL